MKKSMNLRQIFSMTAASTLLSATLITSPVMAAENDTYKTVHNGWLSEYQVQPGDLPTMTSSNLKAMSIENDTNATINKGYLSEYEFQAGDSSRMVSSFDAFKSDAHNGAGLKSWLGQGDGNWN